MFCVLPRKASPTRAPREIPDFARSLFLLNSRLRSVAMAGSANKKQKREEYRNAAKERDAAELPKKKFYRQRAHANPFSDHNLA